MYLMFLNKWHGKKRVQLGKRANIVDESMMKKKEMEQAAQGGELDHKEHITSVEDDRGLQDLSDLKNEDFIYVY